MKEILDNIVNKVKGTLTKEAIIDYDLTDSYVLIYDEAYGVARKRKKLLKNPRTNTYTYLGITMLRLFIVILINLICYGYLCFVGHSYWLSMILVFIPFLYLYLVFDILIFTVKITCRSKSLKGNLKISKEGITDSTFNGIKILFEWKRIKMVIVKKYSVIILTDTPIYFFVNKEVDKQLIREIKRFKSDITIVRNDR